MGHSDHWGPWESGSCNANFLISPVIEDSGIFQTLKCQCQSLERFSARGSLNWIFKRLVLGLYYRGGEYVGLAGHLELYPAPPLSVVAPAEAGHRLLALLVHVHLASCSQILIRNLGTLWTS